MGWQLLGEAGPRLHGKALTTSMFAFSPLDTQPGPSLCSGYMHVESDSMSIVGIEARSVGTSVLRSFCFKVERG